MEVRAVALVQREDEVGVSVQDLFIEVRPHNLGDTGASGGRDPIELIVNRGPTPIPIVFNSI
jgi:hypothetical protein